MSDTPAREEASGSTARDPRSFALTRAGWRLLVWDAGSPADWVAYPFLREDEALRFLDTFAGVEYSLNPATIRMEVVL